MDANQRFGNQVKRYRKGSALSQEELAMRMDADQAYISRLEAGQLNPTLETIAEIAQALDVAIIELFNHPDIDHRKRAKQP